MYSPVKIKLLNINIHILNNKEKKNEFSRNTYIENNRLNIKKHDIEYLWKILILKVGKEVCGTKKIKCYDWFNAHQA